MLKTLERKLRHALRGRKPESVAAEQLPPELELFRDELSRRIIVGIIEARRLGGYPHHYRLSMASCQASCTKPFCSVECLSLAGVEPPSILQDEHQYFPDDLINLDPEEVLLDAGAFTGDTLASFLAHGQGCFREAHCFEPDGESFARLQQRIADLGPELSGRIHAYNLALGLEPREVPFSSTGCVGNSIFGSAGEETMQVANINQVLPRSTLDRLTFVKMDVEGAEMELLRSLEVQIRESAPLMAVCVYHRPEDIVEIPAYLHRLRPDYHLFLRHHSNCRCETVLYAIPPDRLPAQSRM